MEMKTPWWWATSVHGGGVDVHGQEAPRASGPWQERESKPSTRTPAPGPQPGGPQSGSALSEPPSLHSVKK